MVNPYVPDRGDVIWMNMNPQAGHEQAGRRPALVLSPSAYNGVTGLAVVCPITNQQKGYPFEVEIPKGAGVTGVILSDQLKCLDWRVRQAAYKCSLDQRTLLDVLGKVKALLMIR